MVDFQVSGMMGDSAALTLLLLLVKKLTPYATLPCRSDPDDALCMLYSAYDLVVPSVVSALLKLTLPSLSLKEYMLALRQAVGLLGGTIYRWGTQSLVLAIVAM